MTADAIVSLLLGTEHRTEHTSTRAHSTDTLTAN